MSNIQSYDEFLNEGLVDNLKQKFYNWWNNFQNKDEILLNLKNLADNGKWHFLYTYVLILASYWIIPGLRDWSREFVLNPVITPYWVILIVQQLCVWMVIPLGKARVRHIRTKMQELRDRFRHHEFLRDYVVALGNRKNINAAINRLKNDGVIEDKNILNTGEITIIDLNGTILEQQDYIEPKNKGHADVDPYGEEDWIEQPIEQKPKAQSFFIKRLILMDIDHIYSVRFRNVMDLVDYKDQFLKKYNKKIRKQSENRYRANLALLRNGIEFNPIIIRNQELNEGFFRKERSFDEDIKNVKRMFIDLNKKEGIMSASVGKKCSEAINNFISSANKLSEQLKKYIEKDLTQEQLNILVNGFKVILKKVYKNGFILKDSSEFREWVNNLNAIIYILDHIKYSGFYNLEVDYETRKDDNVDPLDFYIKKEKFLHVANVSYIKKKKKEERIAHAEVDPYGEENWG